ncbi:MAG: CDP-alcohol phosphatidyltransferase family protein [Limisphaerales bacterium]
MQDQPIRRPLKTRQARWASAAASSVASLGISPNHISILSVFFAAAAGLTIWTSGNIEQAATKVGLLLFTAIFMQLRLLCNLLDGMVAVEGGKRTKSGEVYNDLPDRLSDVFILIPAGYSLPFSFGPELGWAAGVLAVMTAYVRVLAGSCGATQDFCGPMAKPHRMATLTAACLLACVEVFLAWPPRIIALALVVIVLGSLVTVFRRTFRLVRELESK